jgi:hypothetical protein
MYTPPLVVGLSGLAGAGKDLFCQLLIKTLASQGYGTAKRYALADALKAETRQFMIDAYGIDINHCSREQKDLIRPFLVAHGGIRRAMSKGKHWTNKLSNIIDNDQPRIAIVTDVRYDQYPEDELFWLKNKLNGVFVHISMYWFEDDTLDYPRVNQVKKFIQPPNEHEAKNDPLLQNQADYRVVWEKTKGVTQDEINDKLMPHLFKFVDYLVVERRLSVLDGDGR